MQFTSIVPAYTEELNLGLRFTGELSQQGINAYEKKFGKALDLRLAEDDILVITGLPESQKNAAMIKEIAGYLTAEMDGIELREEQKLKQREEYLFDLSRRLELGFESDQDPSKILTA